MTDPSRKHSLPARALGVVTAALRRLTLGHVPRLFDAAYYRATYPEVARSGIDPFWHYVRRGAALRPERRQSDPPRPGAALPERGH